MLGLWRRREAEAWLVFLGTGQGDNTLTLAAVTGSCAEAEALLRHAVAVLPGRSNEFGNYPLVADSTGRSRKVARIGEGESRTVSVLASVEHSHEVFESPADCEQRRREVLAMGLPQPHVTEVVTNVWFGLVGSDPRLALP